jgi:hypothetical protein
MFKNRGVPCCDDDGDSGHLHRRPTTNDQRPKTKDRRPKRKGQEEKGQEEKGQEERPSGMTDIKDRNTCEQKRGRGLGLGF